MRMNENPHMITKVRSDALRKSATEMPCWLKLSGFTGKRCAPRDTNVMCHLPVHGKGMSTKVSDLHMVCGCSACHDLLDFERNQEGRRIKELYPQAYWEQLFKAAALTQSAWLELGYLVVPDGDLL